MVRVYKGKFVCNKNWNDLQEQTFLDGFIRKMITENHLDCEKIINIHINRIKKTFMNPQFREIFIIYK